MMTDESYENILLKIIMIMYVWHGMAGKYSWLAAHPGGRLSNNYHLPSSSYSQSLGGRVSACAILNIGIREGVFVGTLHLDTLYSASFLATV